MPACAPAVSPELPVSNAPISVTPIAVPMLRAKICSDVEPTHHAYEVIFLPIPIFEHTPIEVFSLMLHCPNVAKGMPSIVVEFGRTLGVN
jgi:hypothetical protein